MLVDQSTNGSFIRADAGGESYVRRDSVPLSGSGKIGLGQPPEDGSVHTIEYSCEE